MKRDLQTPQEVESFWVVLAASSLSSGTEALVPVLYRKANNQQTSGKNIESDSRPLISKHKRTSCGTPPAAVGPGCFPLAPSCCA